MKDFFLGISSATQIPTSSPVTGPEARPSKDPAVKRMEKAVMTPLCQRKSMAKKAPAKKKHVPTPHNIFEI